MNLLGSHEPSLFCSFIRDICFAYEVKDEVAAHEGHPSGAYPVTQGMKVYAPSKTTPEANGLRTMPPTFKSLILTIPVAKTTIFGGVATGNAKAQLHAKRRES